MTELISLRDMQASRELISFPLLNDSPEPSQREIERDAAFYAAATNRPVEETRQFVTNGWTANLQAEAAGSAQSTMAQQVQGFLDLDDEEANVAIEDAINELREVELFSRFLPESMTAALRANVTGSRSMAIDRISRLVYTGEQIQQRLEGMGGAGATALDFAEILVDPFSLVHQRTYRDLVTRYEALLTPGVSPTDFEAGLEQILNEAEDAGFLSEQNRFYFGAFLDTLGSGIYSNDQLAETALGWLDIGLTFAPLAAASTRASLRTTTAISAGAVVSTGVIARGVGGAVIDAGRDFLSAFNVISPSRKSQEVVDEVLSNYITLDTAEGMVPTRHTHHSISTPTIVRGGFLTAPEHIAARNFELNSQALAEAREIAQASGRVFDEETITAFATQLSAGRLSAIREAGELRAIDVEVAVDEFNNIFMLDLLGDNSGNAYRTADDAQAAAGFGDEVIPLQDGTFVVGRRTNISADNLSFLEELGYTGDIEGLMLYRATNPDNLGDGFWARFGSPLAQADPNTSSNLFRGEGVMQRAMHQINQRTTRITRPMTRTQVSEVFEAFKTMARTPDREAMTLPQFDAWFTGTYPREPTRNQQALYLLEQERLDAELFLTANEVYRRAVDMGARAVRFDGQEYVATVASDVPADRLVYNTETGESVLRRELTEDTLIYRTVDSRDLPGNVQYFTGANIEARAVRHSDFLARNSGGHRGYIVNEMQFLVKQPSVHTYADGSTRQTSPNTLLGARTREEADAAVTNINTIMDELHQVVPVGARNADEYLDALQGAFNNRRLNDVVRTNSGFNPVDVNNLESLVMFARQRGLDLRTPFRVVGEGDRLDEMASLADSPYILPNATQADDTRMAIIRGGRGSLPLTRYGGGQISERSVQDTLQGAYAATMARTTEAAYRIRAGQGLIKGAVDSGVISRDNWAKIRNMPLRTQLETIKRDGMIDTSGATGPDARAGRKFQLDLDRLLFRLQQRSAAQRIWNNATRNMANWLYGKNFNWAAGKFDRWSTDPVTALRGLAFDAYLGMFNVSQLLMQSVQVVNIVGIAGTKGMVGASLYGPMRLLLNNQNPAVTDRVINLLHKTVGLDRDQFADMVEMFRRSGRGIVDNNVAEMTMAEDAVNITRSQAVRSFRESGRVFFKEGDLVARISAFNTAYLEAIEKFGRRTAKNSQRFESFIDWRQQVLTQGMTAASRQGYEQLPFMQFMTYVLRINEAIFAGTFSNSKSVLTRTEKLRLLSVHAALFGASASTATNVMSQYIEANYQIEAPEFAVRLAQRGLLDTILSELTGADTAASTRFSSSMGIYHIMESLAREHPAVVLGGPGIQFGLTAGDSLIGTVYQGLRMVATGETQDFRTELSNFARLTSSGNYTYNAMTAYRHGRYLTKRGNLVSDDLDAMDAVFLAFGVPLEEIDSIYSYMGQRRFLMGWLRSRANNITEMHNRAHEALRNGDRDRYLHFMASIAEAYQHFEPWEREQVDRMVRDEERSLTDGFMIELIRRGTTTSEQVR